MPVIHGVDIPSPPEARRPSRRTSTLRWVARPRPGHRPRRPLLIGLLWTVSILGLVSMGALLLELGGNILQVGPPVTGASGSIHMVQPGESLSGIAAEYGMGLDSLLSIGENRARFRNPDRILPGQEVQLR